MSQSQSTTRKSQASLHSYFKAAQVALVSVSTSNQQAKPTSKAPPTNHPHPGRTGSRADPREPSSVDSILARRSTVASQQSRTSSSSPPPSSLNDPYQVPVSPPEPVGTSVATGRVVRSSDDEEEEDSDSSLEDLATLLQPNRNVNRPETFANGVPPSTPTGSRTKNVAFHTSPMPILNKQKFDLKSLASHAEMDRRTEASSKRVKAMQEASEKKQVIRTRGGDSGEKFKHSSILENVVADKEGADAQKVARAVMRTEATLSEPRWYFFDTQSSPSKSKRKPFPTKSIPEGWRNELKDPEMRNQTFVSGYAEDLVQFGEALPDEILLWMLDEMCVESSETLRASYCNTLKQSSKQIPGLVVPDIIRKLFEGVGANSTTMAIAEKIRPLQALPAGYAKTDWSSLLNLIRFLGHIAESLEPRTYVVTLLLRMCVDRVVMENVDIFDTVQKTIHLLCRYIPEETWESCCHTICTMLFNTVDPAALRLQIVECTPSISPRTHDLRRRLAMSFYFDDVSYSTKHSHLTMNLEKFIKRLDDHAFDTDSQTDYRELAALIFLLDIALDDGCPPDFDLKNSETAKRYDESIDELAGTIKGIMNTIGNPGAAFISRIEAKEAMELVGRRISDTLRSRPRVKITVFDRKEQGERQENLDREKKFMASHFFKAKAKEGGINV